MPSAISSLFSRFVAEPEPRCRKRILCEVVDCPSYCAHRNLDNGEQLFFPYCRHHICTALKGERACFRMTEYDEPYCTYHENLQRTRSTAAFEPTHPAQGYLYLSASSTQAAPVQTYPLPIKVTQRLQAQAKRRQATHSTTASDTKSKNAQSAAPQKKLVPCAHEGCVEKIRPERVRCTKHTCHVKRCSAAAVDTAGTDFPYCSSHTCVAPGCIAPKASKAQACRAHRCNVTDCLYAIAKGSFCKDHACRDHACDGQRETDADHCSKHKCKFPGCNVAAQVEGGYCATAHGCAELTCDKMRAANCELPLLCADHNSQYHFLKGVEKAKQQAEIQFSERMAVPPLRRQPQDVPQMNGTRSRRTHKDRNQSAVAPSRSNPLNAPGTNIRYPAIPEPVYPLHISQMDNEPSHLPMENPQQTGFRRQTYPPEIPQTEDEIVSAMRNLQEASMRREMDPIDLLQLSDELDVGGPEETGVHHKNYSASVPRPMHPQKAPLSDLPLDTGRQRATIPVQNHEMGDPQMEPSCVLSSSQQSHAPRLMNPRYAPIPNLPPRSARQRGAIPTQSSVLDAIQPDLNRTNPTRQHVHFATLPRLVPMPDGGSQKHAVDTTSMPMTSFASIKLAVERGFDQLLRRQKTENQDFWRTHEPWETRDGHEELMDKHQVQREAFMKVADERMAAVERTVPYGPCIEVPRRYEKVKQARRHLVGSPRLQTVACKDAYLRELYL